MKKNTSQQSGFTIIELIVSIVAISAISILTLTNIRGVRAEKRDDERKSDVNSMYYQLESFHETNGYYPQTFDVKTLKGVDPESLVDTGGNTINTAGSLYTYSPIDCAEKKCKSFELKATLEKEAPYIKLSLIQ